MLHGEGGLTRRIMDYMHRASARSLSQSSNLETATEGKVHPKKNCDHENGVLGASRLDWSTFVGRFDPLRSIRGIKSAMTRRIVSARWLMPLSLPIWGNSGEVGPF